MSRKIGSLAVLCILVLCTAGAAFALPLDPEAVDPQGGTGVLGEMWARLLDWLDRAVGGDGVRGLEMEGCHIDPNGACIS